MVDWLDGGLDTVAKDVAFATNWDGRFNPGSQQRPTSRTAPTLEDNTTDSNDNTTNSNDNTQGQTESQPVAGKKPPPPSPPPVESSSSKDPLPNMPSCPITGEPMLDPVVAADGHTYERAAIARWLQASDKSPLTGSILPHKELVPNYGLLSSLQEQADARQLKPPPPVPVTANIAIATVPDPEYVEEAAPGNRLEDVNADDTATVQNESESAKCDETQKRKNEDEAESNHSESGSTNRDSLDDESTNLKCEDTQKKDADDANLKSGDG